MSSRSTDRSWNLSRWSVVHPSFIGFLMLACSAAGIAAYLRMGRAEDPSFTIKTAVVSAAWPGATPEEMERYVADLLEAKLRETPNLEYLQTYCMSDAMLMLVQLKGAVRGKAADDAWYQVRKKLDDIRSDLPAGVMGPAVDDEYGDVYAAIYAFTGEDYSPAELKRLCEMARTRLLRVDDIEKVDLIGAQEEQIFVEFSHQKLSTLGITPLQIFDSVQRQGAM
ncbi:MAG: efflux RND transporter permease subunit, partial [Planctomycetota bacterium]